MATPRAAAAGGRRPSVYTRSLTAVAEQPLHRSLGLTDGELDRIHELLERSPNHFELALFSLLWSEHCGYKHSALLLRRLPTEGARVLQGPGENAGVLDLGDGLAVAFKVESHNHPSAVEPFQGAATGVGGILRDISAMGARPVALLDGLRFGAPDAHFSRAVGGVGHYGNCLAGDERILLRNSGRVRAQSIAEIAHERGGRQRDGVSWATEPSRPFQVLSFDTDSGEILWKDVRRIFKRRADQLLRIRASLGRTLTVTPDHPVMIWEGEALVERQARELRLGDRLPLLADLPVRRGIQSLDLIDLVGEDSTVVLLPADWIPTAALRRALRLEMSRADARHYRLSRRELPLPVFLAVEDLVRVDRRELRLRPRGPRATPVPAVVRVDRAFARLIGYYIAEGCCSANGTTSKIVWTFGRNNQDAVYVTDLCDILNDLGIRHSLEHRAATVAITVSSRLLARLLTEILHVGARSFEKQIPSDLMQASAQIRREVIAGIFRGDGCVTYPKHGSPVRVSHSTTSAALHDQLQLLLQSLGIFPSRHERQAPASIAGRRVRARPAYALEFYGYDAISEAAKWFSPEKGRAMLTRVASTRNTPFARPGHRRHGRLASVPVTALEQVAGPADVYDLEVADTHLFATTGGIVTHNCVGVPNVGGETVFDESYSGNCLVNAMCVGLLPAASLTSAKATCAGSLVVLYGATTGRDGIGGASVLASQELGDGAAEKRPSLQVGDPFAGKKLIEVSLELVERGLVESLQDCGAAGLASSLAEMAADYGIDVHLDRVPQREAGMEPWEVMISESQERMVAIVSPDRVAEVEEVCERWALHHAVIGSVTESGELRAYWDDNIVGAVPARFLTEDCPRYVVEREPRPAPPEMPIVGAPANDAALLELLGSDALRSRAFVYRRYDQLVQSRTVRRPGLDAAVLRLRPSYRGLALSLDGQGRFGRLDPSTGGALAVLESARNVACVGGEPIGFTDCLNFGNPEKSTVGWELAETIEGMAQACEALGAPVVSGNVSLYNDTDGRSIDPTPVVGCVGLVPDVRRVPGAWRAGDVILLASAGSVSLVGSEYQARFGEVSGRPSVLDLPAEAALVEWLWNVARRSSLAHDVSEGGLAVALAEAAIFSGIGAELDLPDDPVTLFGEGRGQAIVALPSGPVEVDPTGSSVGVRRIGVVRGDEILGHNIDELRSVWEAAD